MSKPGGSYKEDFEYVLERIMRIEAVYRAFFPWLERNTRSMGVKKRSEVGNVRTSATESVSMERTQVDTTQKKALDDSVTGRSAFLEEMTMKAREEGAVDRSIQIALKMLRQGHALGFISDLTFLPFETVKELSRQSTMPQGGS